MKAVLFVIGAALIGWLAAAPAPQVQPSAPQEREDSVFGFDKLHRWHLTMSLKEWEAMQPANPGRFPRFGGRTGQEARPGGESAAADRPSHRNNAMEFPIAYGDLSAEGRSYPHIALRYKGNFTYMASSRLLKRSLKVDFEPTKTNAPGFHGLGKVNLHAGVVDSTHQREALSYEVFRAAEVPASRTAFVELTLTVAGKFDREYVGLFTLVEQVDKRFLKRWFKNGQGLLLKPQGVRGPEYLGERWDAYEDRYRPTRTPTTNEASRLIAFAKLVSKGSDTEFRAQIDSYLDVDEFLRYLAANAMLVNLDSPFAMPQNFYLYLDAETHRFSFLPWDLDLSLAAWPMGGAPEQQMDLSLMHPHVGQNPLIDRLLAIPAVQEKYKAVLKKMAAGAFAKQRLLKNIETIEITTKEPLAKEAQAVAARRESGGAGFGPGRDIASRAPSPRIFVEKRTESIQAQLSGARSGYTPNQSFGFRGGFRGRGRGGDRPGPEE
jgi:spore coat protein H